MKKIVTLFMMLWATVLITGCYDRDVLDDKGLDYFMPMPQNVRYTQVNANTVTLNWEFPAIPKEFRRPVAVLIQAVEDNVYRNKITLVNEETSFTFQIDPTKKYYCIIKLVGTFTEEAQETGRTSSVTSEGQVVKLE